MGAGQVGRPPAIIDNLGSHKSRAVRQAICAAGAKLFFLMTGGGPVLLHTNMGAGHGGASDRFSELDEVAIAYAFALWSVTR